MVKEPEELTVVTFHRGRAREQPVEQMRIARGR